MTTEFGALDGEATMALYRELRGRGRGAGGFREAVEAAGLEGPEAKAHREELVRLGLIDDAGEDTVVPVRPEVALRRLLARERQAMLAREREAASAYAALGELAERYLREGESGGAGSPVEIEVITGRPGIDQILLEIAESGQSDESSMHPVAFQQKHLDESLERDRISLDRGVRRRTLYSRRLLGLPYLVQHFDDQVRIGVEVRTAPAVPLTMMIMDARLALLPLDLDRPRDGLIVARGSALVRSYAALFEYCWMTATPYTGAGAEPDRGGADSLTEQQVLALRMLAGGAKDERIARALGVSLRTVSRLLSELMQQLGASSRFEAGVRAARLGLLD
ncbi:LuxR C-terminal-related transcriptional regulator [Streptomyces sp. NPDC059524]|uniref:helix-turn-helix transcriptional regulator n=1 Tax=Streptomyces sp. NPDC059524 TaxID=3346856 RepID=UPI0036B9CC31